MKVLSRALFWRLSIYAVAILALNIFPEAAYAQNNTLDSITIEFRDKAQLWEGTLTNYALNLFWLLVIIEFLWMGISNVLKGGDFGEFIASIVNQIFFIGFFFTLLNNSADWTGRLVRSFRQAANDASVAAGGTGNISPSNIFDTGLDVATLVMNNVSIWQPGDSVGLVISAIIIIICFALIAAYMTLALVESYVVISAGVLMLGFGGSRWTKDYALKIVIYALSVGVKLFILQLIVGLGEALVRGWADTFESDNTDIFVIIGSSIVMLALVKSIPELIQGLINGSSFSSGSALTGAAAAAIGGAAGATAATAGAGMAGKAAYDLSKAQMDAKGTQPSSSLGKTASLFGGAGGNLVKAGVSDLGRGFSKYRGGTTGSRMSDSMKMKTEELRSASSQPQPPQSKGNSVE